MTNNIQQQRPQGLKLQADRSEAVERVFLRNLRLLNELVEIFDLAPLDPAGRALLARASLASESREKDTEHELMEEIPVRSRACTKPSPRLPVAEGSTTGSCCAA